MPTTTAGPATPMLHMRRCYTYFIDEDTESSSVAASTLTPSLELA